MAEFTPVLHVDFVVLGIKFYCRCYEHPMFYQFSVHTCLCFDLLERRTDRKLHPGGSRKEQSHAFLSGALLRIPSSLI